MIRNKLFGIGLIITLIISVGFFGCGGDDDDDGTAGSGATGASGASGDKGGSGSDTYTFSGLVQDTVSSLPVPGIKVVALNNEDGKTPLGAEATTDDNGNFTLENLPDQQMCLKVMGGQVGEDVRIDTFTCNVDVSETGRFIVSTTSAIAEQIVVGLIGESDPNEASASGAVYWKDDAGNEYPVDCATVRVVGVDDPESIFYFVDTLPNPTKTQTDAGGRFLVMRLKPGTVTVEALVDGNVIGSSSFPIEAPINLTGGEYSSNISRIYAEGNSDPSPDCVPE